MLSFEIYYVGSFGHSQSVLKEYFFLFYNDMRAVDIVEKIHNSRGCMN